MFISTDGIVLKQIKTAGNQRIVVLFTKKYGKIRVGTDYGEKNRKNSRLAFHPFTHAEYDLFKNRGYYSINSVRVKNSYYAIGEDIDRFLIASKMLEYLDAILEEELPQPKYFDLAIEFFNALVKSKNNYKTILYAFIIKTFVYQGIKPELDRCIECGKDLTDFNEYKSGHFPAFSVGGGGIICEDCITGDKRDSGLLIFRPEFDIVKVLKYFSNNDISLFCKIKLKDSVSTELERILDSYLNYYLDIKLFSNDITL